MRLAISGTMLPVALAAVLMMQGCARKEPTDAGQPAASTPPAAAPAPAEAAPATPTEAPAAPAEATAPAQAPATGDPATTAAPAAPAAGADLAAGKKVFMTYCATCHGTAGKGDGPAAAGLNPKPADFADGLFKYDVNGNGTKGDIEDIKAIAHDGAAKHGGSPLMAPWPMLSPTDLQAVAEYIKSLHAG